VPIPSPTAVKPEPPANTALAMNCLSLIAHLLVPIDVERDCLVNSNLSKSNDKSDQGMRSSASHLIRLARNVLTSGGTDWLKNTSATRRRPLVLAGIRDFLQARLPGGTIC
jgi:hypothetical protein